MEAAALRIQIEQSLTDRIPHALTPRPIGEREHAPSGIAAVDELLQGGFPRGAIAEVVGPECSGRTAVALSFLAGITAGPEVCAWIDAADALDPECVAASGVRLERLLWVRCTACSTVASQQSQEDGVVASLLQPGEQQTRARTVVASTGGGSPHPRSEGRGMPQALERLLEAQPRSAALHASRRDRRSIGTPGMPNRPLSHASQQREEQVPTDRMPPRRGKTLLEQPRPVPQLQMNASPQKKIPLRKSYEPLDRALRAADLLLQAGGFRAIVLDLGSTPAEQAWRIPLATWFRFRAACERSRVSFLLLTKHPCARSSAEVVLHMHAGEMLRSGQVMTGIAFRAELDRQREHRSASKVIPMRRPPQPAPDGRWIARNAWVPA